MKKLCVMMALAAISFSSVYATGIHSTTDTTKVKKKVKVTKHLRPPTMKSKTKTHHDSTKVKIKAKV